MLEVLEDVNVGIPVRQEFEPRNMTLVGEASETGTFLYPAPSNFRREIEDY